MTGLPWPWSLMQPWLQWQAMVWQTAWATPQVIMLRLADLAGPPALWSPRQRKEATRMVIEKGVALGAGLQAAGRVLAGGSLTDRALALKVATAGLRPARRRVGANLARLGGRARRVSPRRR